MNTTCLDFALISFTVVLSKNVVDTLIYFINVSTLTKNEYSPPILSLINK